MAVDCLTLHSIKGFVVCVFVCFGGWRHNRLEVNIQQPIYIEKERELVGDCMKWFVFFVAR